MCGGGPPGMGRVFSGGGGGGRRSIETPLPALPPHEMWMLLQTLTPWEGGGGAAEQQTGLL